MVGFFHLSTSLDLQGGGGGGGGEGNALPSSAKIFSQPDQLSLKMCTIIINGIFGKNVFVDICILNELTTPARSSTVVGSCNGKKKNLLSFS